MKWSTQQLYKYGPNPIPVDGEYDFSEEIKDFPDIYAITPALIEGTGYNAGYERFRFNLHISVTLTLADSITLEPLPLPLELDVVEIFDLNPSQDDDVRLIEKNTVDLRDVIWENILLQKPMRYVKDETQ